MEGSDSDSRNRFIESTPEGERKRVKANMREIAAWFDDQYEQEMSRHHAADILSLNFIKAHSEDFDYKGSDRWVYIGDGATEGHAKLDCGEFAPLSAEDTDDEKDDTDDDTTDDEKLTFCLADGPTGGDD